MTTRSASRAALLELRGERRVVEDGHRFLDEKRALLAHEVLERLQAFSERLAQCRELERKGSAALADAIAIDGLEALLLYTPVIRSGGELEQRSRSFLGVTTVTEASLRAGDEAGTTTPGRAQAREPTASPEARRCGEIHGRLLDSALELASELGNLVRLTEEFQRTQRRVRALEKVVLPELRADERRMEDALEEIDQEEAIRVRLAANPR